MKPLFLPFACVAMFLSATSAGAATYEERLIAHLRMLGYSDITLSFTLLGRAQIIAVGEAETREIVLNPRTGEILRDFAQTTESDGADPVAVVVEPIILPPEPEVAAEAPLEDLPLEDVAAETLVPVDPVESYYSAIPTEALIPDPAETTADGESAPSAEADPPEEEAPAPEAASDEVAP